MHQHSGISRPRIGIIAVVAVILAGGALAAFYSSTLPSSSSSSLSSTTTSSTAAFAKYNVTWANTNGEGVPDPSIGSDSNAGNIQVNVYDQLMSYDQNSPPNVIPAVATSY